MPRSHRTLIALAVALVLPAGVARAAVSVRLNGHPVSFDVPPRVENGRTLVPMRVIFELLGANVSWNEATQTVTAVQPATGTTVVLPIGSFKAFVNGQEIVLDIPARIESNRTLVPLRFVSETLGAQVEWDAERETVDITWRLPPFKESGGQNGTAVDKQAEPKRGSEEDLKLNVDLSAEVVERALRGTVEVRTDRAAGSGFFINDNGTVVTNYHVITGASWIEIRTYEGRQHAVNKVIVADAGRDVAVLETEAQGYPALPLAVSARVRTGQRVIAVGSPLGLSGTLTDGIVSNPDRELDGERYIQHTAPISPGNSGGPLILLSTGEVVGMNTLTISDSGRTAQNINLAIRADTIDDIISTAPSRETGDPDPQIFGPVVTPGSDVEPQPYGPPPTMEESLGAYFYWYKEDFLPQWEQCIDESAEIDDEIKKDQRRALRRADGVASCFWALADEAVRVIAPIKVLTFHINITAAARSFGNAYDALARSLRYAISGQYFAANLALDSYEWFMKQGLQYMNTAADALRKMR